MIKRVALFLMSFIFVAATAGASPTVFVKPGDPIVVAQADKSTQTTDSTKTKKKGKKKSGDGGDEEPECD